MAGYLALLADLASGPAPRRSGQAERPVALDVSLTIRRRLAALLRAGVGRGAAYRVIQQEFDLPIRTVAHLCLGVQPTRPTTPAAAAPRAWAA